jgi:hypothetical protein
VDWERPSRMPLFDRSYAPCDRRVEDIRPVDASHSILACNRKLWKAVEQPTEQSCD